jgi:hypothetical protein
LSDLSGPSIARTIWHGRHRSTSGHFFSLNAERSAAVPKEELGNTRRALKLSFGKNLSSALNESSQLSERFPLLFSMRANSQIQNNALQNKPENLRCQKAVPTCSAKLMTEHISNNRSTRVISGLNNE